MKYLFDLQALDRAHFLPEIGTGKEVLTQYQQLCMALDEYIRKTFHEWTLTIDKVWKVDFDFAFITKHLNRNWNDRDRGGLVIVQILFQKTVQSC